MADAAPASANDTGHRSSGVNGWWVLVVVNAALAAWSGLTPHVAHKMVFGSQQLDDHTTTLWRFLAASFVIITGVAYGLQDAVKKGAERNSSYLLLTLGVFTHELMSLLLTPFAAPLMTREALIFGPPIFITAGSIAAYHYQRGNPGGLSPTAVRQSTMQTVKVGASGSAGLAAWVYCAAAAAFAALSQAFIFLPGLCLKLIFGATPDPKEAIAQLQTMGGGFLLPTAIFTWSLKNAQERRDLPASVFKIVNLTLAAACFMQVAALLPLLQEGKAAQGAALLGGFYGLTGGFFGVQAVAAR